MTDISHLEKLIALKEKGLLSEAEFLREKAKALAGSSSDTNALESGESFEEGDCPNCGKVVAKVTGRGYHPSCLMIVVHLLLCLISAGGWFFVWGGYILGRLIFNKGTKTCQKCGQALRKP